ncbi:hypothetical protein CHN50_18205 [Priestia aryabhattai]|nr:hypothetical protein CHN50_18205 [Priestia aryabhattai]
MHKASSPLPFFSTNSLLRGKKGEYLLVNKDVIISNDLIKQQINDFDTKKDKTKRFNWFYISGAKTHLVYHQNETLY